LVLRAKIRYRSHFFALTMIAYYFHRHFLFGEDMSFKTHKVADSAPPLKFGWFILLSAALVFVPLGVSVFLSFQLLPANSPSQCMFGAIVILFLPMYLIVLSLFGTALPAVVARDGTFRLSQGIRAVFYTMWRLLLGPAVIGTLFFALAITIDKPLAALGVLPGSLGELAYFTPLRTIGFFTTIIAVAVLCEMYRRTRPNPQVD
jgi:hypothetical protein